MNVSRGMQTPSEKVQREADAWFVRRRDGARMPEEEAHFRRWLAHDEAHARAYAQRERDWEALAAMRGSAMFRQIAEDALRAGPARRLRSGATPWKPLLLAACVAVVAVGAVGALRLVVPPSVPSIAYATVLGEQRTETLADGSRITLNTDTQVEVRLSRRQRDIVLQRGEALFDVAGDASRPFVVLAAGGRTTALGTRFVVREQAGSVRVTLLEGRVEVAREGDGGAAPKADSGAPPTRRQLVAGEQAIYAAASPRIDVRQIDVEASVRWTEGRIDIDALPLGEAVAEINRYSATKLRLSGASLERLVVSGAFQAGDNAGIAAALAAIYPLRVVSTTDHEIVLAAR